MRLLAFSVANFRSITSARKISLQQYTLLVGANNEGKSNILHALAIGMLALSRYRGVVDELRQVRPNSHRYIEYDWDRDFPLSKQMTKSSNKSTRIILDFELDDQDIIEFKSDIGSNINGILPIEIVIDQKMYEISIQKPGRGSVTLNKNKNKIARFIANRVTFEYIPAIRTASASQDVIKDLVERELVSLEANTEYRNALFKIDEIQKPILDKIANSVCQNIQTFLPSVKNVELAFGKDRYRSLRRNIDIFVNDGERTLLDRKGDGIQSLVALALMRHSSEGRLGKSETIFAIEEPEAHLHPRAIHELRRVLFGLAESSQIVVSSHSPIFVNRSNLKSNVIVKDSKAQSAGKISDLRNVLGVRFSDNLQNANLVLLVEGPGDVESLGKILSQRCDVIKGHLDRGEIVIDPLMGASGLMQKSSFYLSNACQVVAFLDNDLEGRNAAVRAVKNAVLENSDISYAFIEGLVESELEDFYDRSLYKDYFFQEFQVDVSMKLKGFKGKWSDRVERIFQVSGKVWDDNEKAKAKLLLSKFIANCEGSVVTERSWAVLDALISSLKFKVRMN